MQTAKERTIVMDERKQIFIRSNKLYSKRVKRTRTNQETMEKFMKREWAMILEPWNEEEVILNIEFKHLDQMEI